MTTLLSVTEALHLTALDRCDCDCPARAVVQARIDTDTEVGVLLFCAHHANNHGHRLVAKGWTLTRAVEDES
jgi:hypothetical protein